MVSSKYFYQIIVIYLHTVTKFEFKHIAHNERLVRFNGTANYLGLLYAQNLQNFVHEEKNGFTLAKARSRWHYTQTITDAVYADDLVLLANAPTQAKFLDWAVGGKCFHVNAHNRAFICFNQRGDISILNGGSLKLGDNFTGLGINVSSTENEINAWLAKA